MNYRLHKSRQFRFHWVFALLIACGFLTPIAAWAQQPATRDNVGRNAAPDVVVIVRPESAFVASLGIAYRTQVKHTQARRDLAALVQSLGGSAAAPPVITDASTNPHDLKNCPVTTAAALTIVEAPQLHNNAPNVLPYLQAFQSYSQLEIVFAMDDLNPYSGPHHIDNARLYLDLVKNEGVYRYLALVRDHHAPLGPLADTPEAAPPASAPQPATAAISDAGTKSRWLAFALMGSGTLLLIGLFVYAQLQRRTPAHRLPNTARR